MFIPDCKASSVPDFKVPGPACLRRPRAAPALAWMSPRGVEDARILREPKQNVPAPQPSPRLVHRQDCSLAEIPLPASLKATCGAIASDNLAIRAVDKSRKPGFSTLPRRRGHQRSRRTVPLAGLQAAPREWGCHVWVQKRGIAVGARGYPSCSSFCSDLL